MTSAYRQTAHPSSRPQSTDTNQSLIPFKVRRQFLTTHEAADYLAVNTRTVARWAREGYLPAYPIGEGKRRLWRFLERDLDQWFLLRQTGGSAVDPSMEARTLDASHRCSDRRNTQ